jgi:membrane protein required for colicin V production
MMKPALVAVDYVVVGIVAISAAIGLVRGFVREVLSLAIWALAVILALTFSDRLADALANRIDGPSVRYVAAFAMIFLATLIVGGFVQWLIMRLVETTGLTGTDRLIGLVFGGLRGAVVCIVAVIALRPFVAEEPWWQASRIIPALGKFESDVLTAISSASDFVSELRKKR